ncbi:dephospho-CoA kinase [Candidatus Woesearchaeota archaeon]|nr:dephospho-CoA kinase [Candidatus Woesearchaeota archaeon]
MIIAITGYIGSGKSTAAGFFSMHGYRIINVDELGHELLRNNEVSEKLKAEFGIKVMGRDFQVDRDKLSSLVFNNPERLIALNRIVHPFLKQLIKNKISRSSENTVLDVALFRELNLDDVVEKVILIQTDVTKIYERLNNRFSKREIINVMNNQHIISKADHIIVNNGTKEELKKRVDQLVGCLG